jgi:hypothetical protein
MVSSVHSSGYEVVIYKRKVDFESLARYDNPYLFKAYAGEPIIFHIYPSCGPDKAKYERLIVDFGGSIEMDSDNLSNSTVVLIEPRVGRTSYNGYTFNICYVIDCILEDELLDITEYLRYRPLGSTSDKDPKFMDIAYWKTSTFPKVVSLTEESEETGYGYVTSTTTRPMVHNKHSRRPFSRNEKEAILKFIIAKNAYSKVKGNSLYQDMEAHNICPSRTFQSMRNHFLKFIVNELDCYDFLTPNQKQLFRD